MSTPLQDDSVSPGDLIEAIHVTQLFPIVEALESNQTNYREDIGVADAYKVNFSGTGQSNEIDAYQAGQQIVFKAGHANTGPSTMQVVGPGGELSIVSLTKFGNAPLGEGDIEAGQLVVAIFNDEGSGRFEMIGSAPVAPPAEPLADGSEFYRADQGGAANIYEVDGSGLGENPRPITTLENGRMITFKAGHSNTGASTLNVLGPSGSLGFFHLTRQSSELVSGDIQANSMVTVIYNDEEGGRFEIVGSQPVLKPQPRDLSDAMFREDTGAATNAYLVTFDSTHFISSYTDGLLVNFRVRDGGGNTGASTFEIVGPEGSLTAKPLTRRRGDDLRSGDLVADQMATAIFNLEEDRFELLSGGPSGEGGGGGGEPLIFVGCQLQTTGVTLSATNSTDLQWLADINQGMEASPSSEWCYAQETGYYEVGLVLAMNMPSAESIRVEMFKGDHTGWSNYAQNLFDVSAGFCTVSMAPVMVYLEIGQGFKWMVTPTNDDPDVISGTRCTVRLINGVSSLCCMVAKNWDQELYTNTGNVLEWQNEILDPSGMHSDYSEWLNVLQSGYYEAGLMLSMEMTASESMMVTLVRDNGSESDYCTNQMDGAPGKNLYSMSPIFLQLNEGDRVKWKVEPTLDEPKILSGFKASRASLKFLGAL